LTSQYIPPTGSRQTNHSILLTLKPTSPWRDDSCAGDVDRFFKDDGLDSAMKFHHGDQQAWQVYVTIANLDKQTRRAQTDLLLSYSDAFPF
jgi:hypothetical protein